LLVPSGTKVDPDRKHLFITLTNACPRGFHLLVSLCSIKAGIFHDPTCELSPGMHPFITADSYILYSRPEQLAGARIVKCVEGWTYRPYGDMEAEALQTICNGLMASSFTPRWAKKFYLAHG
jgi:hypothetical protein